VADLELPTECSSRFECDEDIEIFRCLLHGKSGVYEVFLALVGGKVVIFMYHGFADRATRLTAGNRG
jgi:hypothetical protein